ncbi:MAG: NosD domain-containing protein [Promethearchaeota archaeon]
MIDQQAGAWFPRPSQDVESSFSSQYESIEPISIFGDVEFDIGNWPGEGTLRNPYIIEGYEISSVSSGDLITIQNTSVYFIIRNCFLNGQSIAWGGITFYNVTHGIIDNNIVRNIDILGIGIYFSENITIANNEVENTDLNGIRIEACLGSVIIINNTVSYSTGAGIWIGDSSYQTTIVNNTINNNRFGIFFGRDTEIHQGVFSSVISGNFISSHTLYGIELSYSSNNSISYNFISEAQNYGIFLQYPCENTEIIENTFCDNNRDGTSQARDDGSINTFHHNFWNDHTDPDSNNDGIVDATYRIDGAANNFDFFPLTKPTISPPSPTIPINILSGGLFLSLIIGSLIILLIKNKN